MSHGGLAELGVVHEMKVLEEVVLAVKGSLSQRPVLAGIVVVRPQMGHIGLEVVAVGARLAAEGVEDVGSVW